eukprot:9720027-Alexandrium_andersonii.AAC.1
MATVDDGDYEGLSKGWVGEKLGSMSERRRRGRTPEDLPADPYSDFTGIAGRGWCLARAGVIESISRTASPS